MPAIVGMGLARVSRASPVLTNEHVVDGGNAFSVNLNLEPSMRGLCGMLPALGDNVATPVTYKIQKPDGNTFRVTLSY